MRFTTFSSDVDGDVDGANFPASNERAGDSRKGFVRPQVDSQFLHSAAQGIGVDI